MGELTAIGPTCIQDSSSPRWLQINLPTEDTRKLHACWEGGFRLLDGQRHAALLLRLAASALQLVFPGRRTWSALFALRRISPCARVVVASICWRRLLRSVSKSLRRSLTSLVRESLSSPISLW